MPPADNLLAAQELAALQELAQLKAKLATLRGKGVAGYLNDPVGFVNDCVKFRAGRDGKIKGLASYQAEILDNLQAKKRVAVRGPRGLGKSGLASFAIIWFAVTRDAAGIDWKIVTTAGSWQQLEDFLWQEIAKWAISLDWDKIGRYPFSSRTELMKTQLRLRHGLALAGSPDKPEKLEGAHADHVFYVFDESKIIPAATFDAAEGAFSGAGEGSDLEAYALAISTPGEPAGRFYDIHTRKPGLEDWHVRHVTLDEAIAAGRMTRSWAEQRKKLWGENSALYQNHVLGEFCADDEDAVIPLRWVEAAFERWRQWDSEGQPDMDGIATVGVDVARSGHDKSAAAIRHGNVITRITTWAKADTMETTGRVKGILSADPALTAIVDVIGIGAGVYDRLREQGEKADPFTAGRKTAKKDATGQFGFKDCLTGDARVAPIGDLLRIYRSRHEGPLFKVEMASGDQFTATPNHQVLTLRGWVPVQALRTGDKLCDPSARNTANALSGPEVHDMPPKLSEVYRAAHGVFGSERVHGIAVNFHGDRPTGEVDVVTIDRNLLPVRPSTGQECEDGQLIGLLALERLLAPERPLSAPFGVHHGDVRVPPVFPDDGMPGGALSALLDRELIADEVVCLSEAARFHAMLAKDPDYGSGMNSQRVTQLLDGLSRQIAADDLGFVKVNSAGKPPGFRGRSQSDASLAEYPADYVPVDTECAGQGVDRLTCDVTLDDFFSVHVDEDGEPGGFLAAPWLDAAFVKDFMNGGPVSPVTLCQRLEGFAGNVSLDEVIRVELAPGHENPFVYTLETTTGAYRTSGVVHRNCRSAAWWNLREMLDPSRGAALALPPDDELAGDLTVLHYKHTSDGRIQVETKDEVRKRIGRSTDRGDAVIQACWTSAGSWHDAYQTMDCPSCDRAFMRDGADGKPRTACPHCKAPLNEDEEQAA